MGSRRRFNKKADLEMSIKTIVVVILAMTLLGLGLGFVRNMFGNISSIQEDVTEQTRQKILDDLITGDKKVSFPKSEITLDKGTAEILTIGVRNKGDSTLHYKLLFNPIQGPDGAAFDIDDPSWFQYAQSQTYELGSADSDVRNIRLSVPRGVAAGSYFLTFDILNDDLAPPENVYATKDFFIVVRG